MTAAHQIEEKVSPTKSVRREDWSLEGVALFLVIDLLRLPWLDVSLGPLWVTNSATGAPDGWPPLPGVLSALALLAELALTSFSAPRCQIGSHPNTRRLRTDAVAFCIAREFVLSLAAQANPFSGRSRSSSKIGSS
ncbi:MAG: hypothetical protein ACYC91_20445 [Solirubrobacteraceae bacterium]